MVSSIAGRDNSFIAVDFHAVYIYLTMEKGLASNETNVSGQNKTQAESEDCHAGGAASPLAIHVAPLPSHLLHVQKAEVKPILSAVLHNLPYEIKNVHQIPCVETSLYSGMLAGALVSGLQLWRTKRLASIKYGFYSFFGVSIFAWEYCRFRIKYAVTEGVKVMQNMRDQAPKMTITKSEDNATPKLAFKDAHDN